MIEWKGYIIEMECQAPSTESGILQTRHLWSRLSETVPLRKRMRPHECGHESTATASQKINSEESKKYSFDF